MIEMRTIARYGVRSVPGEEKEIIEAFRRGEAVSGPAITQYENSFASYHGMKHAVSASFGRMACFYILRALNLPPNSEVIFPALTFWVVPEIARRAGLRPVFVDVDPATFNIDVSKIERAISDRTRAIVPTHLYGQPCEMSEVMRIAAKHDLIVVEDCAQAVGARHRGKLVGTFGEASFFSFQMLKGINTYGGGMAVTNSPQLAARLRAQANAEPHQSQADIASRFITGLAARAAVSPRGFSFWGFPLQALGSFFEDFDYSRRIWEKIRPLDPFPRAYRQRYSNAQALLGLKGLASLDAFNSRCRDHANLYDRGLADCRGVRTPTVIVEVDHVYYQYCIYTSDPKLVSRRAIRRGVDFETTHVDVCPKLPLFQEFVSDQDYPGAGATETALQLPVYSRLRSSDVKRVLRVIREVTQDVAEVDDGMRTATANIPEAMATGHASRTR